eukprot:TRINITY_DN30285_c0_g1_i1.p1 TRINITY_DN30285_c0_g1~~TRINITY_DN30285_c0_g1_i1.p1  ORF type:complete len:442 (+),score=38.93 TRINITY_DN30285_c0_g1_i1:57-1382(+)
MANHGPAFVVRNTFIDAAEPADDEDLARTRSDPTGGRSKAVLPLQRVHVSLRPTREEAGESEDEDEEEDDGPLQRTKSRHPGLGLAAALHQAGTSPVEDAEGESSDGSQTKKVSLSRLVPEASAPSPSMPSTLAPGLPGYPPGFPGMAPGQPWVPGQPWAPYGMWPMMYNPYAAGYAPGFPPVPGWDASAASGLPPAAPGGEDKDGEGDAKEPGATSSGTGPAASAAAIPAATWLEAGPAGGATDLDRPPLGTLHSFHQETREMGTITPDFRIFTKVGFEGRLSVVSESQVHTDGVHRYLVQFSAGELSRADGVGFVFAQRLPCAKNIQRIVSIFVNQRGRICMRIFADIVRASASVKTIELYDWVELIMDLDKKVATFRIWPPGPTGWPALDGQPTSRADFPFGNRLGKLNQAQQKQVRLNTGHLACVVKNVGSTITLAS